MLLLEQPDSMNGGLYPSTTQDNHVSASTISLHKNESLSKLKNWLRYKLYTLNGTSLLCMNPNFQL